MSALAFQYIIIGVIFLLACWYIFKMIKKNFSTEKFSTKNSGCDKNCGCS